MIIPSGIIIMYIGTHSSVSGLSGWARNTDFDTRYVKGTADGTDPADTTSGVGGASTHTHSASDHTHGGIASHTHTGTSGQGDDAGYTGNTYGGGWPVVARTHTHSFTTGTATATAPSAGAGSWIAATNDPARYSVIFLESDGTAVDFPDDAVTWMFAASNSGDMPTGWSHHTASVGKFFLGSGTGANAGTVDGSSATHAHSPASHGHGAGGNHDHADAASGTMSPAYPSSGVWWYDHGHDSHGGWPAGFTSHTHTSQMSSSGSATVSTVTGGNSSSVTAEPPFRTLTAIVNDSGAAKYSKDVIVLWDGDLADIPTDWTLCDGSDSTPDMRGKFPKNTTAGAAVNATGGAVAHPDHGAPGTHSHVMSHNHTVTFSYHGDGHYAGHNTPGTSTPIVTYALASGNNKGHSSVTSNTTGPSTGAVAENIAAVSDSQPLFRYVAFLRSPEAPSGSPAMFGANF